MANLLDRYKAGARDQVWGELVAMGSRVRDPAVLPDALAVAHETMARVAANVDILLERLIDMGYWFRSDGELLRSRPDPKTKSAVWTAEEKAGPLPLSLRACLLEVGSVDLCGQHPNWPPMYGLEPVDVTQRHVYADPLCISPASYLMHNIREWEEEEPSWRKRHPVEFEFAPDEVHKANFSGGPAYGIQLPYQGADPTLRWVNQRPGIRLVAYLRTSLSWGGFPGFEFEPSFPSEIQELRADLLPV